MFAYQQCWVMVSKLMHVTVKVMCHGAFLSACCSCITFPHNVHSATATLSDQLSPRTPPVCPQTVQVSLTCSTSEPDAASTSAVNGSPSLKKSPSSQDSNSLSLLTEMSGVEAPVPLRSVSVLQSLVSGLPRWRGELGNKWGWWWRSWWEPSGELSEGRREGSCCILGGGRDIRVRFQTSAYGRDIL